MCRSESSRPRYEQILFHDLRMPSTFFQDQRHLQATRDKLAYAAGAMPIGLTDFVGLNVCIHVAGSAVLLGSDTSRLKDTLENLRAEFRDIDPTTVVTAASLYHIIKTLLARDDLTPDEREGIERLQTRFNETRWLVGDKRMNALGMLDTSPVEPQGSTGVGGGDQVEKPGTA